jgi:hypothetical protein
MLDHGKLVSPASSRVEEQDIARLRALSARSLRAARRPASRAAAGAPAGAPAGQPAPQAGD